MKKIFLFLMLSLFLVGFVFAENGGAVQNGQDADLGEDDASAVPSQRRGRIIAGEYSLVDGKKFRIGEGARDRVRIQSGEYFADCDDSCELREEKVGGSSRLKAKLSNGREVEVKIMPDTVSQRALERLRLKNCVEAEGCTIELKEVGSGEEVKLAYELKRERESKVFGLFKAKMQVRAQVDAETGDVIRTHKPWWAFLATEPEESEESDE
jgi:hypothetical protein